MVDKLINFKQIKNITSEIQKLDHKSLLELLITLQKVAVFKNLGIYHTLISIVLFSLFILTSFKFAQNFYTFEYRIRPKNKK